MSPDSSASVGLLLNNQADPDDNCQFSLKREENAGTLSHGFDLMFDVNDYTVVSQKATNPTTSAAVRYHWNSATQTLRVEYDADGPVGGYNWITLRSVALNSGSTNWEMNSNSAFIISTGGISSNVAITVAGNVWLDNFSITGYPPSITTHPTSQNVAKNSNVTFSVDVNGTGLNYQWQKMNYYSSPS